jgi:hypothetical protein
MSNIGNFDNAARSTPSPGNRHIGDKREQEAAPQSAKETRMRLEWVPGLYRKGKPSKTLPERGN